MSLDSNARGIRPVTVPAGFASLATYRRTSLGRADCDSRFTAAFAMSATGLNWIDAISTCILKQAGLC